MAGKDEKKIPDAEKSAKPKRQTKAESSVAPRQLRSRIKEDGVLPKPRVSKANDTGGDEPASSVKPERSKRVPASEGSISLRAEKVIRKPKLRADESLSPAEKPSFEKKSDAGREKTGSWIRPERVALNKRPSKNGDGNSEKPEQNNYQEREKKAFPERQESNASEGRNEKKQWSKPERSFGGEQRSFDKDKSEKENSSSGSGDFRKKPFERAEKKFASREKKPYEKSFSEKPERKRFEKNEGYPGKEENPLNDPGRNADFELKPEKGSGFKRPERRNIKKDGFAGKPSDDFDKPERKSEGDDKFPKRDRKQYTSGSWRGKNAEDSEKPAGRDSDKNEKPGDERLSRKESFAARRLSEKGEFKKPFEKNNSEGKYTKPGVRSDKFRSGEKDAERPAFRSADRKFKGDAGGQDWEKPFKSPDFVSGNKSKTFRPKKAHQPTLEETDGKIRLNKYISNSGVCSRREADQLISSGAVKVNGKIVTELGTRVSLTDKIQYGDQTLNKEIKRYLLLNKPKDYITTASDPEGRKTVMDLVKSACKERLYPVGRLDRGTTGLLLLTNDGELAKKLTHPSHEVKKLYHVSLDKSLKAIDMKKILEGLELEDGKAEVDEISYVGEGNDKSEIGVALHSGKNRIVRRIFEHLGYDVVKLDRTYFAGLTKKDLPRGKFRMLTEKEIIMLRMS